MPLTPEQQARVEIDRQLTEAGWVVQDYGAINIHAADGVAVREFPLKWMEDQKGCTRPRTSDCAGRSGC